MGKQWVQLCFQRADHCCSVAGFYAALQCHRGQWHPDDDQLASYYRYGNQCRDLDTRLDQGAARAPIGPRRRHRARREAERLAGGGGERYNVSFGADTSATNFLYDAWVYLPSPASNIANLEFDLNQVTANGDTIIFGFQCDYWSKTWDYTANAGTTQVPIDVWLHSRASCNVQSWSTNTWHHVQIRYSQDGEGNVTYQAVWLDNVQQGLNITVPDAFALGWSPTLLTNFQVDSMTASEATTTAYIDNLTVYRW